MPANRADSSELAASVGEISGMADSEESITILARKVFMRLFEVSGFRSALALCRGWMPVAVAITTWSGVRIVLWEFCGMHEVSALCTGSK